MLFRHAYGTITQSVLCTVTVLEQRAVFLMHAYDRIKPCELIDIGLGSLPQCIAHFKYSLVLITALVIAHDYRIFTSSVQQDCFQGVCGLGDDRDDGCFESHGQSTFVIPKPVLALLCCEYSTHCITQCKVPCHVTITKKDWCVLRWAWLEQKDAKMAWQMA